MKKYLILSFMLLPFIGLSQDILISEGRVLLILVLEPYMIQVVEVEIIQVMKIIP